MEVTMRESSAPKFRILMFPWLAHGHIFPFMELSKRLAKSNFHIYFCSTEINLNSIKQSTTFKSQNSPAHSIELVQLDLPDLPELPPHYQTTKNMPPHLRPSLWEALEMAKPNFKNILHNLKPDLLIYDGFQPWAAELASSKQIPSVFFLNAGAANLSYFSHARKCRAFGSNEDFPSPAIFLGPNEIKKMSANVNENLKGKVIDPFKNFDLSSDFVLVKTWRGIEGKYIDILSSHCGKKLIAIGPLNNQDDDSDYNSGSHIIQFLNSKPESSVVYVSFGSEYFLSKEEREEMATGLEQSNANFIWVVRFPVGNAISLEEALPEGFLERVKGRGIVVDGWAPQVKILEHPSTGAFVSHCGWSSVMESIYYGVPFLALPLLNDQPLNARLAVEIGVGVEILKDENGEICREEVARVINEVVVEKKEVEILRGKCRELSKKLREEGEEELNEAVEKLRLLCSSKNKNQ